MRYKAVNGIRKYIYYKRVFYRKWKLPSWIWIPGMEIIDDILSIFEQVPSVPFRVRWPAFPGYPVINISVPYF